jgi:uncharacterized protein YneR
MESGKMFDWLREIVKMRGLKRVVIIEKDKRASPIDVTKFLDLSKYLPRKFMIEFPLTQSSLDWVHSHITYKSEEKDFWKFPNETLADGYGDCEDGAILLACLLLKREFEVDSTGHVRLLPYYAVLVNVFDTEAGFHVAVTVGDELRDWTNPTLKTVPDSWKLWYCFNRKHAYTLKENADKWRKR